MSLVASLVQWTQDTFAPLGAGGLFLLAFVEAVFFPVPPDLLLLILSLANPHLALFYAAVCTAGTTIGGMLGYGIGLWGEHAILERFFKAKKIKTVHDFLQKYEVWGIAIAGFTPIPYKVFAISAGVFYLDFRKFVFATAISRGIRFFLEAVLIMFYGQMIMSFIEGNFDVIAVIGYVIYKRSRRQS